jgi:hypothetical protein
MNHIQLYTNLRYSLENIHTSPRENKKVGAAFAETKNDGTPTEDGVENSRKRSRKRKLREKGNKNKKRRDEGLSTIYF